MTCEHNPSIDCPCPHECASHGKCCECVNNHRQAGSLPLCFRREPFVPAEFVKTIK